jgi:hypothetical protein
VANAGLKVADFSVICGRLVRVAAKGVIETHLKVGSLKLEGERFGELNAETQSTQRSETGTGLEIEVELAASMGNGSTDVDYCQGNSTIIYHSNVRHGSGANGRGWREFCSLVRRL